MGTGVRPREIIKSSPESAWMRTPVIHQKPENLHSRNTAETSRPGTWRVWHPANYTDYIDCKKSANKHIISIPKYCKWPKRKLWTGYQWGSVPAAQGLLCSHNVWVRRPTATPCFQLSSQGQETCATCDRPSIWNTPPISTGIMKQRSAWKVSWDAWNCLGRSAVQMWVSSVHLHIFPLLGCLLFRAKPISHPDSNILARSNIQGSTGQPHTCGVLGRRNSCRRNCWSSRRWELNISCVGMLV